MIYLASDHGGYHLKKELMEFLKNQGLSVTDLGPYQLDPSDDYPDFAFELVKKIQSDSDRGILICRTGHGMAMAANRFASIRAAVALSAESARLSRQDENSNVLVLAADYTSVKDAQNIVQTWLDSKFEKVERHARRIGKISKQGAAR